MKHMASVTALTTALLVGGVITPAHAAPAWEKTVKCQQEDWDSRVIPTRAGNDELGWRHLSGPHNIRKCRVVNAALNGEVVKKKGNRLEYSAYAWNDDKRVTVIVIVQYSRKTTDGRYDAGRGKKIGVITAYCKGMNMCPDWINR
ncbi:hypothetical protein [Streptomyces anulatus]|uniref:hypothetical protein n=1 Tax=Streptomyces anulatus TaxID=1892 RepID=UPI001C27A0C2|nr:hypothetical protein [Streptomyces anulatus]